MKDNIIDYKIAVSIFRNFHKQGLLTDEEFRDAEVLLAEKYGISLCSIFREIT